MRLFIAIPLPSEVKDELHGLMQSVSGIRWQNYKQLHITLKFLGDTETDQLNKLSGKLNSIKHPPFTFTCKGLGYFPEGRQPRVLWIGVENETPIGDLQGSIEDACTQSGFECESRPFKPHITLGKVKGASKREVTAFINQHKRVRITDIPVEEFILYESKLSPDGATHKPHTRFPLTNGKTGRANGNEDS